MGKPKFKKITILGLGLIGGSVALDAKRLKLAKDVVGYNRSRRGRQEALKRKAVHSVYEKPEDAVQDADLVILATPVLNIPTIAKKIAPFLKKGALVTDVGSTKEGIVKKLNKIFPKGVNFVGGHPISGTEHSGMEYALKGLFQDRWWIFTPTGKGNASQSGVKKLIQFARALGAKTAVMSPRVHDETLAAISHLPHMAAYALVGSINKVKKGHPLRYTAGGFKDFTRIAASSPNMWTEICLENSQELIKMMKRYQKSLEKIQGLIQRRDTKGLQRYFEAAAAVRRKL